MITEKDIAERCKQGDRESQKLLYETYAGWLLGVCLRYVGDRDIAQDLLHDGFVQVFTHFGQFQWKGEGSLKAWLFRVQQNVVLMYLRKEKSSEDSVSLDDNLQLADVPEPETVHDIPQKEILRMISELPTGYRTVFNMFVIDGYSHKDIAKMLGIQEKSSASQLVHAKRLLATRINAWRKENL